MEIDNILQYTVYNVSVQDFLVAIVIFSIALLASGILSSFIIKLLKKLTQKTDNTVDDRLLDAVESPLKMSIILLGFYISKESLRIPSLDVFLNGVIKTSATLIIFWILFRLVHEFSYILSKFSSKFGKKLAEDIENFIVKTLKIFIIIIGIMSVLQGWGINISAFIASLGLIGMAFALAAKDTAANFFGSLVIFTDRPFRIGDWVQIPHVEGVVEQIGIRSTKIRDFSQALTSVPNAVVANSAIMNWSKMGKRRISARINLTYGTTSEQVQQILKDLRQMLQNHQGIHKDTIMINFDEFKDSSLSLFCYYFTTTTEWAKFLIIREDINLKIMEIIERNGASFAFPSQSIYVESMPK